MSLVLSYILVGGLAFTAGFLASIIIRKSRNNSGTGTIKVIKNENKILYSLELHDDPTMLEHKREVVFKVETSDESSNRE